MLTPYRERCSCGDRRDLQPADGRLAVRADDDDIVSDVRRFYPKPQNVYVLVKMRKGGVTPATTKLLEERLKTFPDAKIQTEKQFEHSQEAGINILLNLLFVLLGFSIVISLFGIVNTLVLTVFERTRELGMLRAVGMTRRQVRRMIRHESVVTGADQGGARNPARDRPGLRDRTGRSISRRSPFLRDR